MRSHVAVPAVLSSVLGFVAACGPVDSPPPGESAASDKARLTTAAPAGDVQAAVDGNTAFALDLYRKLTADRANVFFSPYSITVALAMTYGGARGDTATAFEKTMHISLPADRFHHAVNTIDLALGSRGQNAQGKDGKPFRLKVVNQLFAQKGYVFLADYLDLLATEYGAGGRLLDFIGAANASRMLINDWVARQTEDRIVDLLPEGSVDESTRLVLANAIYFNAAWRTPFKKAQTSDGDFTLLDGSKKRVPMMAHNEMSARAAVVDGTDVVELAYDGNELSMILVAPPAGQFDAFEAKLSPATLAANVAALKSEDLTLRMPKFSFRANSPLKSPLKALGLGIAFSGDADLSGIDGEKGLQVMDVLHQAFVAVDEAGTEAAAATAVIVGRVSIPQTRTVTIDRPFVFFIRDAETGAVVFFGRVVDP